jgi:hypothetical protein
MAHKPSRLKHLLCHILYLLHRLLERYCPPPPRALPRPKLHSFIPGELSVLAELTPGAVGGDWPPRAEEVVRLIRARLPVLERWDAIIDPSRLVLLVGTDRAMASMFVTLPSLRNDPAGLLRLIDEINPESRTEPPPSSGDIPGGSDRPRPRSLGAEAQSGGQDTTPSAAEAAAQIQLLAASPNWLGSASQQIGTTGGPGADPVLVDPPQISASGNTPSPWSYTIPPELLPSAEASTAADRPVTVAILDTAPRLSDIEQAHQRWVGQAETPHPLLEQLCGPAGAFAVGPNERLEVTPAPIDIQAWVDADLHDHCYVMSDHGLFIAGIVASIAPQAHLHLIEVLNPYGAGSLESLLQGLRIAIERHLSDPTAALVINCSLMINSPAANREAIWRQSQRCSDIVSLTEEQVRRMNRQLEYVLEFAKSLGNAAVIAAAGNDGTQRYHGPPARFPAAYPQVVGVGALDTNDTLALYSNTSDKPASQGLAIFGGNVASNQSGALAADPSKGVLGVYIGAPPDKLPNQSGWARWAGTSFATPVVSALIARWLAAPKPPKAEDVANALISKAKQGSFGGQLHVKQGP